MRLLSADEVKETKDKSKDEAIQKILKLRKEETRLVKSINDLLESEKEGKEKVAILKSRAKLKVYKSILEKEVELLEKRKQEAIQPICRLRREAEELKNEFEDQLKRVKREQGKIEKERESLVEKGIDLKGREELTADKQEGLDNREVSVRAAEEEIKRSTNELSEKWMKFHEEVNETNKDIEKRSAIAKIIQKEAEDQKKTNESIRMELDAEKKRLENEDKAIQDKYLSLRAAQREILGHEE